MIKVHTIKLPFKTNHFNEGQRVFVEFRTGGNACKVRGKYRGKGRYISAWFHWNDSDSEKVIFKEIELREKDYNSIYKYKI